MTSNDTMFLLLAEELNFSRAAQRAFVTQQCLSDHIKRLEQKYGTALFYRRPQVALTPAGETMLRALRRIQVVEQGMEAELRELEDGARGTLTVGMGAGRAQLFIPSLWTPFHQQFPQVALHFRLEDTVLLSELLRRGELDFFIGVDTDSDPDFTFTRLYDDPIFLVACRSWLEREVGADWEEAFAGGALPERLEGKPLVRNLGASTLTHLLDRHLAARNLTLEALVAVNSYDVQLELCTAGQVAGFFPATMLRQEDVRRAMAREEDPLLAFPIRGLDQGLRIDLVRHSGVRCPRYAQEFCRYIVQEGERCRTFIQELTNE